MADKVPHAASIRDVISGADNGQGVVLRALHAVREHLGLQVAYVSEIVGDQSIFRHVDAPGLEHLIKPGDSQSLDNVYCRHILEGRLPQLIPDTAAEPLAMAMPITAAVPIGAHVSVPLRLTDGTVYGMFCCLGPHADPTLNERDLGMMRAFAELAAFEIDRDFQASKAERAKAERIAAMLESEALEIVYQPICGVRKGRPIGFECLSRFASEPVRPPDHWFAEAAEVGQGPAMELMAIRRALVAFKVLPRDVYLTLNASPETVLSGALGAVLAGYPLGRIVIEITEHSIVDDFAALARALAPLRKQGMRLAVDDAGAGYSGLQQILHMRPDIIKLDRSLIHGICDDPSRRALASALMAFARETNCRIVAEGVETESELAMLRALGVDTVQGFLLGYPLPLAGALALLAGSEIALTG